ncbi:hypothetical protein GCM10027320_33740 [Massilia solisilvae]
MLEKFVHADEGEQNLVLVAIDLSDDPSFGLDVPVHKLPPGWNTLPNSPLAAEFGTHFLQSASHLYMRVPSVIVHEGTNLVINPLHPAYDRVRLEVVRPFSFDPRMFKR